MRGNRRSIIISFTEIKRYCTQVQLLVIIKRLKKKKSVASLSCLSRFSDIQALYPTISLPWAGCFSFSSLFHSLVVSSLLLNFQVSFLHNYFPKQKTDKLKRDIDTFYTSPSLNPGKEKKKKSSFRKL